MLSVYIEAISVSAPGLEGWENSKAILIGENPYIDLEMPKYVAKFLPANERRRTTPVIKLALQVAESSMQNCNIRPSDVSSVFATSEGDTHIVDKICTALIPEEPLVSPTHFHNSVHNAPAGYWAMATESRQASTSLSGFSGTYTQGLLEAATMVVIEDQTTLLVAYDCPAPEPLLGAVPMQTAFGTAHLLTSEQRSTSIGRLDLSLVQDKTTDTMGNPELEAVRLGNPAARSLPLLQAAAKNTACTVILPYLDNLQLSATISPC